MLSMQATTLEIPIGNPPAALEIWPQDTTWAKHNLSTLHCYNSILPAQRIRHSGDSRPHPHTLRFLVCARPDGVPTTVYLTAG
jgi:hypothetical protein